MEVNGQLHISVALSLGNVPAISIGLVGTSASLEILRKGKYWELRNDVAVL